MAVSDGRVIALGDIDGAEYVTALDEKTGHRLWAAPIGPAGTSSRLMRLMRWLSQRTPTLDDDRLYVLTARGRLVCLNLKDGTELWRKSYSADFGSEGRTWGFCDYPLVDGEALVCLPLGSAGVVALNKVSGDLIWKQPLAQRSQPGYGAVISATVGGMEQYIVALGDGLAGFSAADGARLWWHENPIGDPMNTHTPILLNDGSVFSSIGYRRCGIVRIEPHRNGSWDVRQKYAKLLALDPFQDSAFASEKHIYAGRLPAGTLTCIDWRTGETVWTQPAPSGRPRLLQVGLTYADGHIYCLDASGTIRLIVATPTEYVEASSYSIVDYRPAFGATLPVVTGGRLYIRDDDRLLCFDVRSENLPRPAATRVVLPKPRRRPSEAASPDPIFVSTPYAVVEKMLDLANVDKESVVVDLGSGDGRIVIAAGKRFGCRAVGYEIDPKLVRESRAKVEAERVGELVSIRDQDMLTADLSDVDVVLVYLNPDVLERLKPQFARMKPGSRIVSHFFEIPGADSEKRVVAESDSGEGHEVFLYVTPIMNSEARPRRE